MDRNRGFDINALRQQLEDLFEDFFPSGGARRPQGGRGDQGQQLPVNLVESEEAFVLTAPLPGLQPDDIEINVRGQNFSLRAQRKNQPVERPNFVRREWGFGPYQRSIDLPAPVDAERASAAFRQGVVTITIPKADRAHAITIEESETAQAEETDQAEETMEAPAEAEGATVAVTDEGEGGEAQSGDASGGRSFYMPRQGGGRRGRYQGRDSARGRDAQAEKTVVPEGPAGTEPEAPAETETAAAPDEWASAVTPEMEGESAEQVMFESDAQGAESTTGFEGASDNVPALGSEPPQEPGAEDVSPVAHTTTASTEAHDLGDQAGASINPFIEPGEGNGPGPVTEADDVTDTDGATGDPTSSEPTD